MNNEKIEIRDSLVLDNNLEYIVTSKANYENKQYLLLVNPETNYLKFGYESNGNFIETDNKALMRKLMPSFYRETKKIIDEISRQ